MARLEKKKRSGLTVVIVAVAAASLLGGCEVKVGGEESADAGADAPVEQPVPVEVEVARVGPVEQTVRGSAPVEARYQNLLVAEAAGTIQAVHVEEGEAVKQGQLLAELRNPELLIARSSAASNVGRLQRELTNLQPLLDKGYVPRQSGDELRGQLEQAKEQLARVNAQVDQLRVRSPIEGIVARRSAQAGQQVAPGAELFHVVNAEVLQASLHVPADALAQLREGAPVWAVASALGEARFMGKVRLISPVVNPQTGTIKLTVDLEPLPMGAAAESGLRLRPGLLVHLYVITDQREGVTLIPRRAVAWEDNQPVVFVIDPGPEGEGWRARKSAVTLGYGDEARVEVREGVKAEQRVIVVGQAGLKNGTPVQIPGDAAEGAAP